eukprot:1004762-Amphidinium_carterae.3
MRASNRLLSSEIQDGMQELHNHSEGQLWMTWRDCAALHCEWLLGLVWAPLQLCRAGGFMIIECVFKEQMVEKSKAQAQQVPRDVKQTAFTSHRRMCPKQRQSIVVGSADIFKFVRSKSYLRSHEIPVVLYTILNSAKIPMNSLGFKRLIAHPHASSPCSSRLATATMTRRDIEPACVPAPTTVCVSTTRFMRDAVDNFERCDGLRTSKTRWPVAIHPRRPHGQLVQLGLEAP